MGFVNMFWDGMYLKYDQAYTIILGQVILIICACISIVCVILMIMTSKLQKLIQNQPKQEEQQEQSEKDSLVISKYRQIDAICFIFETMNLTGIWLIAFLLVSILCLMYSFELIGKVESQLYFISILLLALCIQIWRMSVSQKCRTFNERLQQIKNKTIIRIQLILIIFLTFVFPLLFSNGCLCEYNKFYGINLFRDFQFSTQFLRQFYLPDYVCPRQEICHVYATLPYNATNEVIINVHTGINVDTLLISLTPDNQTLFYQSCIKSEFPSYIEDNGQRNIYNCYIKGLLSNQTYQIQLFDAEQAFYLSSYRTPPENGQDRDLVIMFGGDFGQLDNGLKIAESVSLVEPDIILIGGDIAYDNGNINCYYSYDTFFDIFEEQFQIINRIVPFIFSIGNHDVGYNDYAQVDSQTIPLYFYYFPQSVIAENDSIPTPQYRSSYNVHKIQKLLLFGLDSGYLAKHDGKQSQWIISQLQQHTNIPYIIAHYHVPLYPSCIFSTNPNRQQNLKIGQEAWIPIFDQYNFTAALENHLHQFKRTYPLKYGLKNANGTIYIGDGSMGVNTKSCKTQYQSFIDNGQFAGLFEVANVQNNSSHFWILRSKSKYNQIEFIAYTPDLQQIQNSQYQKNDI